MYLCSLIHLVFNLENGRIPEQTPGSPQVPKPMYLSLEPEAKTPMPTNPGFPVASLSLDT